MDNFDKIKFKKTKNKNWFVKIDLKTGEKIDFPKKHGFYQEMQAWKAAGYVIEEAETSEEKAEIEAKENEQVLNSQKSICIQYLNESEKHMTDDPPYPDDVQIWKDSRKEWRRILKSSIIEEIPAKPFN